MANFLIVVDPDPARRAAFAGQVRARIAPLDGLALGECACADFHALWACGPRAPVDQSANELSATVIWGMPMAGDGTKVTAARLADEWGKLADVPPPAFDGYFAATTYDVQGGLVIGADILGLFPVFWWQSGDVILVGSSAELFQHHPLFRFELDPAGLVGILLLTHSVDGRSLMAGVWRLGPGAALVWRRGGAPREVTQYALPASTAHFDLPFAAATELVDETLRRSVARHVPSDAASGLMLSGGRDSRLLAGVMADLGRRPVALTFGEEHDIEMRCARAVARALGLEHHTAGIVPQQQAQSLDLHVRWQHCCGGFNSGDYWKCREDLEELPAFLATGYVLDSIIGGSHFSWAYSPVTREMSFDTFFSRNNRLAVKPGQLRKLLRPQPFGGLVDDVVRHLRSSYESYSELEAQRAWCFDLHHRQRFHVGAPPWQFSFGSWPLMPAVDRDVLAVTGGIPAAALDSRRLQDEILRSQFPHLAELPLDRNGYVTTPLSPRLRQRVTDNIRARIAPVTRRLGLRRDAGPERRFYFRLLDFNGPAWKLLRRQAEPHRAKLHALFDRQALDAMLPPPEVDLPAKDGIIELSGKRLLVGLCLWAGRYL